MVDNGFTQQVASRLIEKEKGDKKSEGGGAADASVLASQAAKT
jgi:hypothetical protein